MQNLRDFLIDSEKSSQPMILFIDEVHSISREMAEILLPLIEDFLLPLGNIKIRPFIFIGATNQKNILLKKFSPLVSRCGCQIDLEDYKPEDIREIIRQYNDQTYKSNVPEEIYNILSMNTRFNPRISIALFDDFQVAGNIKEVLEAHRIISKSLTDKDIKVLEALAEVGKPMGLENLAIITQQSKEDFVMLQEDFLISQGYISRTNRGRIITNRGINLLKELKNE